MASMAQDPPVGIGYSIGDLVSTYHPDVVLEMLGVNDLAFGGKTPAQVAAMLVDFVDEARAEDPGVDVVLGRIPQPWRTDVQEFNSLVEDLADDLDSEDSRVVVADADSDYSLTDSFDSAHPNARGELKIAAAFEDALAALGVGQPAARPVPNVPLGPRIPPVLSASGGLHQAALTWVRSPGSHESEIWARDVTTGEAWHRVAEHQTGTSVTLGALPGWHHVQLRTAPFKGTQRAAEDAWSNVVDVEVLDDHLDAPVPTATASPQGLASVRWAAVPGAASYTVQWRRSDQPDGWVGTVSTTVPSASVGGLANRTSYVFRVRAVRDALASRGDDEAGVPPLGAVRRARLARTAHGVRATGTPVPVATSYTLRAATTASCAQAPRERRFTVAATGLGRPKKRLRIDARAVWVRWVAVREDGVEGDLVPSSTDCIRLR